MLSVITDEYAQTLWMNMLRGCAISAVVIHHWLLFVPYENSMSFFCEFAYLLKSLGGTAVHLFFILSGCGLTISYFRKDRISWRQWAKRRFGKIIVPFWITVTFTFILVNLLNFGYSEVFDSNYSWLTLLSYLTFTRNLFSPAWDFNPTMWFMPVIFGLYVLFPLLVKVLEKYGAFVLLGISVIITYSSITLCIVFGYTMSHQSALFPFYIVEFSFGMFVGYLLCFNTLRFKRLLGGKMFCLGVGMYGLSWAIRRNWIVGEAYNDLLTGIAIFLITLNACQWMTRWSPQRSVRLLSQISKESYFMYLIHGPLILFVVRPLFAAAEKLPLHPLVAIVIGFFYCVAIFMLAQLISKPVNSVGLRFYRMSY